MKKGHFFAKKPFKKNSRKKSQQGGGFMAEIVSGELMMRVNFSHHS